MRTMCALSRIIGLICVCCVVCCNISARVYINEIMAANVGQFMDPTFNFSGWIELYNSGDEDVSMQGWYLSDESTNRLKYRIPHSEDGTTVPAKGYLVIWCEKNDLRPLSTNFKLDCDGGDLYLSNEVGVMIDHVAFPLQLRGASYARTTDGGNTWRYCANPTFNATNVGALYTVNRCPEVTFSQKGGLFTTDLVITTTIPTGMVLRYTTDGSDPTEQSAVSTSGQFFITQTTTLRARLFAPNRIPGPTTTHTYIKEERNFTLPIISIVGNPDHFFDDSIGIYVTGVNGIPGIGDTEKRNWNQDWSRPVSMELIDPITGTSVYEQECDVSISGGYSRLYAAKSLVLNAEKKYEWQNRFEYPFFTRKPNIRLKHLLLRNSGNDHSSAYTNGTMMHDALVQSLVEQSIDIECQAYQPAIHYINGQYYGIINMRERNNKQYVYSNFGYEEHEIDFFESGYLILGSWEAFDKLVALSRQTESSAQYDEIKTLLDIEEYINYMAVEIYGNNRDWPHSNIKWFRHRDNGKFRFILYDTDQAFKIADIDYFSVIEEKREIKHVELFLNLLNNTEFRKQFIDKFCLLTGSVFTPQRIVHHIDSLAARINAEMHYHQALYGEDYLSNLQHFKHFGDTRPAHAIRTLANYFTLTDSVQVSLASSHPAGRLFVNEQTVPLNTFSGILFAPITLSTQAPAGYSFERWENAGVTYSTDPEIILPQTGTFNLRAVFSPIAENPINPVRINEVSASNSIYQNEYYKREDWVELYNTTSEPFDLAGLYISDTHGNKTRHQFPTGKPELTVIPAYGHKIVWCDRQADNTQLHANFALASGGGTVFLSAGTPGNFLWTDSLSYWQHGGDVSVGRYPDGGNEVYLFNRPSFNRNNEYSVYNTSSSQNAPPDNVDLPGIADGVTNSMPLITYYADVHELHLSIPTESYARLMPATVRIVDATGRLVHQFVSTSEFDKQISLPLLPAGWYIATVRLATGEQGICKFMVQ